MVDINKFLDAVKKAVKNKSSSKYKQMLALINDDDLYKIDYPILHIAIERECVFNVLIQRNFNLRITNEKNQTILTFAINHYSYHKHIKTIAAKQTDQESYNDCNRYGIIKRTKLECAVECGLLNVVKWCHDNNDEEKCTSHLFGLAAQRGHLDIIQYLCDIGLSIPSFAFLTAATNGHLHIIKWYYEHGYKCSRMAITTAAIHGYLDVIQYLIEHGCTCSTNALTGAAQRGYQNIVEYLIVNVKCDWDYITAIKKAETYRYRDIAKYISESNKI